MVKHPWLPRAKNDLFNYLDGNTRSKITFNPPLIHKGDEGLVNTPEETVLCSYPLLGILSKLAQSSNTTVGSTIPPPPSQETQATATGNGRPEELVLTTTNAAQPPSLLLQTPQTPDNDNGRTTPTIRNTQDSPATEEEKQIEEDGGGQPPSTGDAAKPPPPSQSNSPSKKKSYVPPQESKRPNLTYTVHRKVLPLLDAQLRPENMWKSGDTVVTGSSSLMCYGTVISAQRECAEVKFTGR